MGRTVVSQFLLPSTYPTRLITSLSLNGFGRTAPSIRLDSRYRCHSSVPLEQPAAADTSSTSVKKRILSGVQPTGSIHLGNYLGAIKNWISLQNTYDALFFIVDLHAKSTTASSRPRRLIIAGFFAALTVAAVCAPSGAQNNLEDVETLSNIPQTLSATTCDSPSQKNCKKLKIQHPKSKKAESCTIKCVTTCIRGGNGSPGEGPFNIIRPLVVFKQGFRSRQYCLVECSDICNLLPDDDP